MFESVEEYVDSVLYGLLTWCDAHSPETWAENHEDILTHKKVDLNQVETYFGDIDALDLYAKYLAHKWQHIMRYCQTCKSFYEAGYGCDCPEPGADEYNLDDLISFYQEISYEINPGDIENFLEESMFWEYTRLSNGKIQGVWKNIADVFDQLEKAESSIEILTITEWASHLFHVGGQMLDYFADREYVLEIRQSGLASVFTEEQIATFGETYTLENVLRNWYSYDETSRRMCNSGDCLLTSS